jgi:predicted alpha/beta-hydrolase family hydrolase
VNVLFESPKDAFACYVVAHGAGAGMKHPFMAAIATGLAERGVATLRYEFPYMERGSKRPDTPAVAKARVREAVAEALRRASGLPLFAGGKSFGGRMTSQGKPSDERAAHLADVKVPMLFLQGTRDDFATLDLLRPLVKRLGKRATLEIFDDADHSFHVPARSGRTDAEVMSDVLDRSVRWMREQL